MRTLVALVPLMLLVAGCLAPDAPAADLDPAAAAVLPPEPVVAEFKGRMMATPLAPLAHREDTEMRVADIQREGIVYEITEVPHSIMVELEWRGMGLPQMAAMVTVPVLDGQGTGVWDYFTPYDNSGKRCIIVPPEDLQVGRIALMAHSRNAVLVDYVFRVTTVGGAGAILPDVGHMEVERPDAAAREYIPCEDAA